VIDYRKKALIAIGIFIGIFIGLLVIGQFITPEHLRVNLLDKFKAPSMRHPFGTDWVGRDMFLRTLKGLSISMQIGILCAVSSGVLALLLGVIGPLIGGKADAFVSWLVDLFLAVPHTLVVILVSIALGGGLKGIVIGVTVTHWTSLTRVIRAEVLQIKGMSYTKISRMFGKSYLYIARHHVLPHVLPQLIVGVVLIFPHAILHEAAITFLGFGLPPHEPAIGVILAEAMKYLTSGKWWLAFFPGFGLILLSMMVENIGKYLDKLINPKTVYK
jgi:peptide/nickel transport system permease protein